MRGKEMAPLCCISLESFGVGGFGDKSPVNESLSRARSLPTRVTAGLSGSDDNAGWPTGSESAVAGILYKWTNYGKGWRSRWFLLRNGILSYAHIHRPEQLNLLPPIQDVRMIGEVSTLELSKIDVRGGCLKNQKNAGTVVHLKISSFRESKSDDRRFYVFTATKTLHLRTCSRKDRIDWIQALATTRSLIPVRNRSNCLSIPPNNDFSASTVRLRNRLIEEGVSETLVKDCERIMLSEFSEVQLQLQFLCEERSNLLDTLRHLEVNDDSTNFYAISLNLHDDFEDFAVLDVTGVVGVANIEVEATQTHNGHYQLLKHEFSTIRREKFSECSTTESSDDVEKQEIDDVSGEDEISYYDTRDSFTDLTLSHSFSKVALDCQDNGQKFGRQYDNVKKMQKEEEICDAPTLCSHRRKKLPDPVEKEKRVSLWSIIKDNVGKDLTRVCLPVYFNEPLSSLQKCCEDLEYSYLLDRAYKCGKEGNNLQRILNVAAFAVSGYASTEGRECKPFNPLLGETYEAEYPEKGIRFISEKVSHHPTLVACHCEGKGWKFWGDSNLRSKFWGMSIQLDPIGILTLEFDDGEIFQWSKVTTNIYNIILGKVYCDHHGTMHIRGNQQYSCKLKFKEHSILDRNRHQVHGYVEDVSGKKVATLFGKWNESMYYIDTSAPEKSKSENPSCNVCLLWKSIKLSSTLGRYNLTPFAITLNELTSGMKKKLPTTDSRLRPDQRHLENGEYEKANSEKQRLERRQRISRKLQESGWNPRWFKRDAEDGSFSYAGGYWEARETGKWDGCADIFGELNEDFVDSLGSSGQPSDVARAKLLPDDALSAVKKTSMVDEI